MSDCNQYKALPNAMTKIIMVKYLLIEQAEAKGKEFKIKWLVSCKHYAHSGKGINEKIEENIHESDLDKFIKQAESEEKYNLAIRLYYLAIIKELSLGKLIKWKRNKTNRRV